jgi:hypothetical protein
LTTEKKKTNENKNPAPGHHRFEPNKKKSFIVLSKVYILSMVRRGKYNDIIAINQRNKRCRK